MNITDNVWEKTIDGFSDWIVPSKDELNLMYTVLYKNGKGNFKSTQYWTSSIVSAYSAYEQDFSNGVQDKRGHSTSHYVRPIRQF